MARPKITAIVNLATQIELQFDTTNPTWIDKIGIKIKEATTPQDLVLLSDQHGEIFKIVNADLSVPFGSVALLVAFLTASVGDTPAASVSDESQPVAYVEGEDVNYFYHGTATPGTLETAATWRIWRQHKTTSKIDWADGDSANDNIWDDGAGTDFTLLTYS